MESLKEYADLFERLKLTELTVEEGDRRITLRKTPAPVSASVCAPVLPAGVAPAPGTAAPAQNAGLPGGMAAGGNGASETAGAAGTASPAPVRKGEIVRSPLLGVFYARVNGEVRRVGETVRRGDVLCTIEAMKMMNEVTAPCDGEITEILAADGALVEYNQELFVIG